MKAIRQSGRGFAAVFALALAAGAAGCASQQQAQNESARVAAPVASPASQEVREGLADMVLTSRQWPSFAEASANRITSVAGGSPIFVHIRASRSLGELALPADPHGRYAFSAYPILYLHVGDTESLATFSTCYLTLTPQEAAAQELVVSLLPPGDRPGGVPADCLLSAPAAGGPGRRTYEIRLAGFAGQYDSWLPQANLLSVATVPSDYSRSVAASAAVQRPAAPAPAGSAREAAAPVALASPSAPAAAPSPGPRADAAMPAPTRIEPERRIEPARRIEPERTMEPERRIEPERTMEPERRIEPERRMEPERRADAASRSEPWNLVEPERRPAPETRTEPERRSGPQGTGELPGRIEPAIRANPNPEARAPVGDASALPPSPSAARIVIHHYARDAAAAARALALQARLTSLPEVEVEIKPVTMLIAADNIRVFFESDRPKAHRAIERLASGPIPIRNFSDYRPLPRPGTIELWLAATDSSSAAASLPETTPAPTSAPSSAPTSAPTSAPNSGRTSAPASAATSAATSTSASPSRSASAARSRRQEVPPSPSSAPTRSGAETLRLLLLQPDEPKSGNR